MKRILFVVNVDWFFMSHRLPIALQAIQEGYEVHLACSFSDKKFELEQLGIICHSISFSRSGGSILDELTTLLKVRSIIKQVGPKVVHAVTIKPVLYSGLALQLSRNNRSPSFVAAISGLGYVFTAKTIRARITKTLVSVFYKLSIRSKRKIVIFQNDSDKNILSKIVSLKKNEMEIIKGSGADLSIYKYHPERSDDIKVVSMACRLLKEKGVYNFVEAARIVKKRFPETEFRLIGDVDFGNPNSISKEEVESWVNEGVIVALGQRGDIPWLFSESNLVTLPSFYGEGVPKVLIEAAACGRPIVTTNNPGCRDAVIENETGITVPIRDSASLAKAIIYLLENKGIRQSMGLKARDYAVKEFDVNNVVKKHLDIYESLMVD
ncbi:glycosyltransferase family 4 protein [Vibrio parahaemolyticus]|uniref:Glycosyl transferase n=5 Tax=Vibrio harveyi group TaxID=717610 RepID=A0A5P5X573_VIBPH|nr:glycosyltransferase family 4 protein [Vibrio parahaemolyticus]EHH1261799.1 glycosyltransferase family 4 protein [Vibrio parahaemolyticus]EHH1279540.1 glycosyltransferase family 4 protein [Vibrio parahaemolyticus]EHK9071051.1 glycosyltransferase family 4 protein [Vibrio parahaemolyticus]EIU6790604.1 glycosyltransferase family 4 protein [Vibrio parahaemolyticus]EIY6180951.1 glycosyltransferase family 4 protein [Vibrio parahaemolyticus]